MKDEEMALAELVSDESFYFVRFWVDPGCIMGWFWADFEFGH